MLKQEFDDSKNTKKSLIEKVFIESFAMSHVYGCYRLEINNESF